MKAKKLYRRVHALSYSKTSLFQMLLFGDLKYKCDSILHCLLKSFATEKQLEIVKEYSKLVGFKSNTQNKKLS